MSLTLSKSAAPAARLHAWCEGAGRVRPTRGGPSRYGVVTDAPTASPLPPLRRRCHPRDLPVTTGGVTAEHTAQGLQPAWNNTPPLQYSRTRAGDVPPTTRRRRGAVRRARPAVRRCLDRRDASAHIVPGSALLRGHRAGSRVSHRHRRVAPVEDRPFARQRRVQHGGRVDPDRAGSLELRRAVGGDEVVQIEGAGA